MSQRPRHAARRFAWLLALLALVLIAVPASASGPSDEPATIEAVDSSDVLSVGPGQIVTPSGNLPSPEPSASIAARPTPQETYDPIIARQTARPGAAPQRAEAAPALQSNFAGEDIAT